ncbi:TolC family protein [Veronia nyctiphanis]|uniref:TolC family protein n=1 Tax=Veronia nyctiphanis TaxID=1278244 RepID=UPI002E265602
MFAKTPLAKKSALAFALLSLSVSAANAQTMSFTEAWQQVLQQSDALAAKQANVDYAAQMEQAAYGYNLPKVTLGATYMRLDDDSDFKPSHAINSQLSPDVATAINQLLPNFGASLDKAFADNVLRDEIFNSSIRAVWPIFTGGKITAGQDIAKAKTEEAKQMLAMEQQAKFEDLTKVYFSTVFAKEVLNTRIESERSLKKHLEHATKMEEQGQIARVERLQAEVSYDKARTERKKAERDLEIANAALRNMVQSNDDVTASTALFVQDTLPSFAPFLSETLATYPGLKVLDAKYDQASGLVKVERSKYAPNVYMFGNYDLHEGDSIVDQIKPDWVVASA